MPTKTSSFITETHALVDKAKAYALKCHRKVNQTYDGHPYEFHLQMVNDAFHDFKYLIPEKDRDTVEAALWLHDTIEDTGITYNDVANVSTIKVANIVYALTNNKGKNRRQRANTSYYRGIRAVEYADFAKMCDRLANIRHSDNTSSSMFKVYRKEHHHFIAQVFNARYLTLQVAINAYMDDFSISSCNLSLKDEFNRLLDKPILWAIEKLSNL
jgi:(p)ppGpp synthase/HD superfamily hydrolase